MILFPPMQQIVNGLMDDGSLHAEERLGSSRPSLRASFVVEKRTSALRTDIYDSGYQGEFEFGKV